MSPRLLTSEVILRFRKKHGDLYDYSSYVHSSLKKKGKIICRKHGEFSIPAELHIAGHHCEKCQMERLQELESSNIFKIRKLNRRDWKKTDYGFMLRHYYVSEENNIGEPIFVIYLESDSFWLRSEEIYLDNQHKISWKMFSPIIFDKEQVSAIIEFKEEIKSFYRNFLISEENTEEEKDLIWKKKPISIKISNHDFSQRITLFQQRGEVFCEAGKAGPRNLCNAVAAYKNKRTGWRLCSNCLVDVRAVSVSEPPYTWLPKRLAAPLSDVWKPIHFKISLNLLDAIAVTNCINDDILFQ